MYYLKLLLVLLVPYSINWYILRKAENHVARGCYRYNSIFRILLLILAGLWPFIIIDITDGNTPGLTLLLAWAGELYLIIFFLETMVYKIVFHRKYIEIVTIFRKRKIKINDIYMIEKTSSNKYILKVLNQRTIRISFYVNGSKSLIDKIRNVKK